MGPTTKQARILWWCVTALAVVVLLSIAGLLIWGAGWVINRLSAVVLPLAVAGILAFIFDPLVDFFERRSYSRLRSIWIVFLLAVLAVVGLSATVVPRLVLEVQSFVQQVPGYVQKARERADRFVQDPPSWIPQSVLRKIYRVETSTIDANQAGTNSVLLSTNQAAGQVVLPGPATTNSSTNAPTVARLQLDLNRQIFAWAAQVLPKVGAWLLDQLSRVASVAGFIAGLALVPVYLFYFLLEKRKIEAQWKDFLPIKESQAKEEVIFILSSINDCLIVFFRGQVLVAMCVGVLLSIGFSVIGLDYALLLGVMAGILGIVPYLGVAMSLIPAVIIAIIQFGDWLHPLGVLGIFAAVQTLEGLVISPKIIGDRVGLHPLTVIIAVMTGTTLFGGILGGVLAIPLTATLRALMFRYVWKARGNRRAALLKEAT